jgi:hypothetical protein
MAGTIPTTARPLRAPHLAILRAQLLALEMMYAAERRCETARRILDLIHDKRDEISAAALAVDRDALDDIRSVAA